MIALSRLLLLLVTFAWSMPAVSAKIPEGTSCTIAKPIALFKGAKGKKRVAKLAKDDVIVLGAKKGRRFAVTLSDGRSGFVAAKMAHKFCPKPPQKVIASCIADAELPLFKKPKGKKRLGKVAKGTKVDIGKTFKYRKGVLLADGRKGFIPKKKLAALCVEIPVAASDEATPASPATPATPAVAATPAEPATPGQPGKPATPAVPAGGPTVPSVTQPSIAQPVVNVPAVASPNVAPAVAPGVTTPTVPGAVVPVVTPPSAPATKGTPANASASAEKDESEDQTAKDSTDGESQEDGEGAAKSSEKKADSDDGQGDEAGENASGD